MLSAHRLGSVTNRSMIAFLACFVLIAESSPTTDRFGMLCALITVGEIPGTLQLN